MNPHVTDEGDRLARMAAARLAGDPAIVVARIEHRAGLTREVALRVVQQLDGDGLADLACIVDHLEFMAATLSGFVPGRLDEIADLYGDVVFGAVLGMVGEEHLYDNARLEERAAILARALDLPASLRFPHRGKPRPR